DSPGRRADGESGHPHERGGDGNLSASQPGARDHGAPDHPRARHRGVRHPDHFLPGWPDRLGPAGSQPTDRGRRVADIAAGDRRMTARTRTALAVTYAVAAITVAACTATPASGPDNTAAGRGRGASAAAPPVPVTVSEVVQKSMPLEVRAIGSAEAALTVAVRAQITGALTSVHFQ